MSDETNFNESYCALLVHSEFFRFNQSKFVSLLDDTSGVHVSFAVQ